MSPDQMNIDSLAEISVKLTEASNNYGALNTAFGVFLALVLGMCIIFFWQTWSTQKKLGTIEDASERTLKYFNDLSEKTIGHEQAEALIKETFERSSTLTKYHILKIRLEHHAQDRDLTETKIKQFVQKEFQKRRELLGKFIYNDKVLSLVVDIDDNDNLVKLMQDWVYREDTSEAYPSIMDNMVGMYYDGICIECKSKLEEIS